MDKLSSDLMKAYPEINIILREIMFIDKYLPKLRYPVSDRLIDIDLINCWENFQKIEITMKNIISKEASISI